MNPTTCRPALARPFPLITLCLLLLTLGGCKSLKDEQPVAAIPVMETAQAQFEYALRQSEGRQLALITDKKRFARQREIVRQQFVKVVEYFPEDRRFTPIAKAELIEMKAGLDLYPRTQAEPRQLREAIKDFRALMEEYPEIEILQAQSMFDTGLCFVQLHQYQEGQQAFKWVWDTFGKHEDPVIRGIALQAYYNYTQTYTQE